MHVTFNDVAVYMTEEEWRKLDSGQLQLYMEVMNENYASLQSLGLPVPEPELLQCAKQQMWKKRLLHKAGERPYKPIRPASYGLGETISRTSGSPEIEENGIDMDTPKKDPVLCKQKLQDWELERDMIAALGCEPPDSTQNIPETHQKEQNSLASFRKKMLRDSSLEPKCLECNGILRCYCDILKQNVKKPFVCEDCGKSYRQQMYLLLHHKSHFQEHLYKCSLCEKSFDKDLVLRKHMKTHQGLTGQPLNVCRKATRTPPDTLPIATEMLPDTTATGTPLGAPQAALYSCKQCEEVFPSKNLLKIHSRDHKKGKTHTCLICGQIVNLYAELNIHLKGHKKPYRCSVCEKIFTNRPDFMAHFREHSGEQIYKCKVCKKGYSRLSFLLKHVSVHLSQATQISKLDQSSLLEEYKEEVRETENTTVFHGLPQKEEEFTGIPLSCFPSTPKANMDTANMDTANMDTANMDTANMDSEQTLKVRNEHPVEFEPVEKGKRIKCKKCKKRFRYRESFRRHRRSHQIRFMCRRCGKVFRKLVELYLHRREHKSYRPFVCKHCTKTFSSRSLLLLHLRSHDFSEKGSRYPCAYCRKVFRLQANCILHEKTHIYNPAESPPENNFATFGDIQRALFSDQKSVENTPREGLPAKISIKPANGPPKTNLMTFGNIQIAPFSDQKSVATTPCQGLPAKISVKPANGPPKTNFATFGNIQNAPFSDQKSVENTPCKEDPPKIYVKPANGPPKTNCTTFGNIQNAPFSDQKSVENTPCKEGPPAKISVKPANSPPKTNFTTFGNIQNAPFSDQKSVENTPCKEGPPKFYVKPANGPPKTNCTTFGNIQITPFSDQKSVENTLCKGGPPTKIYVKPANSPPDTNFATFGNIQIAPYSDQKSVENAPCEDGPPAKIYVKQVSYWPCL